MRVIRWMLCCFRRWFRKPNHSTRSNVVGYVCDGIVVPFDSTTFMLPPGCEVDQSASEAKRVVEQVDQEVNAVLGTFEINCPGKAQGTVIKHNGQPLENVRAINVVIRVGEPVRVIVEYIDKPKAME